jgi:extracellular elastinolytic metalloproteinase
MMPELFILQYRALPINQEYPPEGFANIVDPQDTAASPFGWHNDGTTSTISTAYGFDFTDLCTSSDCFRYRSGNNVISYKDSQAGTSLQSSSPLNFIYTYDPTQDPGTSNNLNAARVNTFFVANTIHDISYRYGFNEAAFNFQTNNFQKGGRGNDRVTVSVQDIAGVNNADFATPPE